VTNVSPEETFPGTDPTRETFPGGGPVMGHRCNIWHRCIVGGCRCPVSPQSSPSAFLAGFLSAELLSRLDHGAGLRTAEHAE